MVKDWTERLTAAKEKRMGDKTGDEKHYAACLEHLKNAVTNFEELTRLTDRTYINATDMRMDLGWPEELKMRREDLAAYKTIFEMRRRPGAFWIEAEEMDGQWLVGCFQRLFFVGYSERGFRYPNKTDKDPGLLSKTIEIKQAGDYMVWARGLVGQTIEPIPPNRAFIVEVAGNALPPTHAAAEQRDGKRAFVWRRAGTVHLPSGKIEIKVRAAGGENNAPGPDVIFLTNDATWKPDGLDRCAKYSNY